MFILACIVCGVLLFGALKLSVSITWGIAKVIAYALCAIALPVLIVSTITVAGGIILLLPVFLIAAAWGILRTAK